MISGSVTRIMAVASFCALLGGCGGMSMTELTTADLDYAHAGHHAAPQAAAADDPSLFPGYERDNATPSTVEGTALQCVPYARDRSGVNIHGDAYTWWDKAAGVYARGATPLLGSVMVLNGYAGRHRAHVAVVRRFISAREISIDHANWLDDGAVYVNDPVIDVSADNDWTMVKVWNIRTGSWGSKIYRVQGFIGPGPANANPVVADYRTPSDPIARQIAAASDPLAMLISDNQDH
jgi:surface antigen